MAFTQLISIESSDQPITLLDYINSLEDDVPINPSDPPMTLLDYINSLPSIEDHHVPINPSHRNAILLFDQQPPAPAHSQLDLSLSNSCPSSTIASSSSSSCFSSSKATKKRKATSHDLPETSSAHRARPRPLRRPKNNNTVLLDAQVSTELTLAPPDPFVIKKTLEDSDVNTLARLMLSKEAVERHLLPYWDDATKERLHKDKDGVAVKLWDMDEEREHDMKMKLWGHNKSYVLNDRWITKIVRNRKLKKGDQIGLCWDAFDSRLVFSVLQRRPVQVQAQEQQPIQATPIRFCAPHHHHH